MQQLNYSKLEFKGEEGFNYSGYQETFDGYQETSDGVQQTFYNMDNLKCEAWKNEWGF